LAHKNVTNCFNILAEPNYDKNWPKKYIGHSNVFVGKNVVMQFLSVSKLAYIFLPSCVIVTMYKSFVFVTVILLMIVIQV